MYERVYHFADLHLRKGNERVSYYERYVIVIDNVLASIREQTGRVSGKTACVICGDVFHHKTEMSPPGMDLFKRIVYGLAKLVDTVILIQGNHDLQQASHDKCNDMIRAMLQESDDEQYFPENVHYLSDTGVYLFDNLEFGVVSITDILRQGAGSGTVDDLPAFPKPSKKRKTAKIALAHCMMRNSNRGNTHGIPDTWFSDYDVAMLGDVHIQQVVRTKHVTYGYPGSLLQQDFGEDVYGHGYLEWRVNGQRVELEQAHHVPNPWAMVKMHAFPASKELDLKLDSSSTADEVQVQLVPRTEQYELRLYDDGRWVPLLQFFDDRPLPSHAHVRLTVPSEQCMKMLKEQTHRFFTEKQIESKIDVYDVGQYAAEKNADVATLNKVDTIMEFLEKTLPKSVLQDNPDWREVVQSTVDFKIEDPLTKTPTESHQWISESISKANRDIEKLYLKYDAGKRSFTNVSGQFELCRVEFDWILAFGKHNVFDFEKGITLINAPNGYGKSAFFEVIVLGLFGETIPSRGKSGTNILNNQKPKQKEVSQIRVVFELNGVKHTVHRKFGVNVKAGVPRLVITDTCLYVDGQARALHSTKATVNDWIQRNVCTSSEFMLFNMITQSVDCDFMAMTSTKQLEMLDDAFHITHFNELGQFLKTMRKEYKNFVAHVNTYLNGCRSEMEGNEIELSKQRTMSPGELEALRNELRDCRRSLDELQGVEAMKAQFELSKPKEALKELLEEQLLLSKELREAKQNGFQLTSYPILTLPFPIEACGRGEKTHGDRLEALIVRYDSLQERVRAIDVDRLRAKTLALNTNTKRRSVASLRKEIGALRSTLKDCDMDCESLQAPEIEPERLDRMLTEGALEMLNTVQKKDVESEIERLRSSLEEHRAILKLVIDREDPPKNWSYKPQVEKKAERLAKEFQQLEEQLKATTLDQEQVQQRRTEISQLDERLHLDCASFDPDCAHCVRRETSASVLRKQRAIAMNAYDQAEVRLANSNFHELQHQVERSSKQLEVAKEKARTERARKEGLRYQVAQITSDSIQQRLQLLSRYDEMAMLRDMRDRAQRWKDLSDARKQKERLRQLEEQLQYEQARAALEDAETLLGDATRLTDNIRAGYAYRCGCNAMVQTREQLRVVDTKLAYYRAERDRIEARLNDLTQREREQHEQEIKHQCALATRARFDHIVKLLDDTMRKTKSRCTLIDHVVDTMQKYKAWVYNDSFLPSTVKYSNKMLLAIFGERSLRIEFDFEVDANKNDKPTLVWGVKDEGNSIAIEKLSGAQRFMVGLSVRFGLGATGATKYACKQLFMDEGFCSFDRDNLMRVPCLLNGLQDMFDQIVLVTHLEEIKHAATHVIDIQRSNGLSSIRRVLR